MESGNNLVQRWASRVGAAAIIVAGIAVFVSFVLGPGTPEDQVATALRGISRQRPEHSLPIDGRPLPIEARMLGIFVGFAGAVATSWLGGRWRRSELPRGGLAALLLLFLGLLGLDGLNALFFGAGWVHLYAPRNELRLATGLLGGLALASFAAPVVNFRLWRGGPDPRGAPTQSGRDLTAFYARLPELLRSVTVAGLLGLGLSLGVAGGAGSSAIVLLAVTLSFGFVNLYLWSLLGFLPPQVDRPTNLGWGVVAALALTAIELAGFAQLRAWAGLG